MNTSPSVDDGSYIAPGPARYGRLLAVLLPVIALIGAIVSVDHDPKPPWKDGNFSPHGYTLSLGLFLVPTITLSWWLLRERALHAYQIRAFLITAGLIVPTWCLLDILLGNTFFVFPNPGATMQIFAPGYSFSQGWMRNIPIEEFAFYILGSFNILLGYIWASESWLCLYSPSKEMYDARVAATPKLVNFRLTSLALGVAIFLAAVAWKKLGPHHMHAGFPGYFLFELLMVVLPIAMLDTAIGRLINGPAFVYKMLTLVFISLLWEVTLAIPYGWWGYQSDQMMGIVIRPWFNLPLEAAILWPCAAQLNIYLYEAARFYLHKQEPLLTVLFGPRSRELPQTRA